MSSSDITAVASNDDPAEFWLACQWAEETGNLSDFPVFDAITDAPTRRSLADAWEGMTGETLDSAMSFDDLLVVPACIASTHAEKVLSRVEVAAYAAKVGMDDPHEIAARLTQGKGARAEQRRARVAAMFGGAPVPIGVSRVPDFPLHALPAVLADMVSAVAGRLDVDPGLCAPMALGAMSAAIGGHVNVQVYDGWTENGVAYILVVADSGQRKSPAMDDLVTGPIGDAERILAAQCWDTPIDRAGGDSFDVIAGEAEFTGPEPRLTAADVTPEKLAALMEDNSERMTIADAEGEVFEVLSGMYSAMPSLGVFVSAYTGEPVRVDRVSRPSVHLDQPALTMCLATRPHVASAALANPRFVGRGFVARIEFAYPESRKSRFERGVSGVTASPSSDVVAAYKRLVTGLAVTLHDKPRRTAALTEAAQRRMQQISAEFDHRVWSGDLTGTFAAWGAKSAGRIARRALHLHMAEHGRDGVRVLIETSTVERALEIEEWFIANARQAFGVAATGEVKVEHAQSMLDWLIREHDKTPYEPIAVREISRRGPSPTRQTSIRNQVLDLLRDLNYVVPVRHLGGAGAVYLNPASTELAKQ
ncbi:YfjI family protein [Gordonia sp. NPDC003376]